MTDEIALDLYKKLNDDVQKAIDHFLMIANVADLSLSQQATIMMACFDGYCTKLATECQMSREEFLESMSMAYDMRMEHRRRRKFK